MLRAHTTHTHGCAALVFQRRPDTAGTRFGHNHYNMSTRPTRDVAAKVADTPPMMPQQHTQRRGADQTGDGSGRGKKRGVNEEALKGENEGRGEKRRQQRTGGQVEGMELPGVPSVLCGRVAVHCL